MQRCCGCMKEFGKEYDVCPYCGYIVDTAPKMKNHLFGGTILSNRYMLGKVLGYGGFGITYIAWDKKLNRTVAIKEFFPNSLSTRSEGETQVSCYDDKASKFFQDGVKKMLDEGNRLSKFSNNENVVNVYDCFEENNTAYIVMEYLEGKDLKKYLEENGGKLEPEKAVEIILPVINALEDMHKENLIHRDVSPDNIFLCDNGKIKLLDFGSARLAVEDSDKSLSVMVKRGYAPKEQYASRSKQGPWTDVYAVCATLYKMITGVLPIESTEREEEPLKKFSELGITGYDELETIVFKGLEVEYTSRIQNVSELKNRLIKAVEAKQTAVKSTPKSLEITKKEKMKINPKVIIAAVLAVVVVAGVALGVKFVPRKNPDKAETTTVTQEADSQASKELVEKAMKAYEKRLSQIDDYFSAYIVDINKDGISEVICQGGDVGIQFALTYTEKDGLRELDLIGHSGMSPEVYISEDNCIYMRDDGHNQGTAFYHHASVYKIDETGFVLVGEVEGDEPEEFDWEDEAVFSEMDAKYEDLFEKKLYQLTGEKAFKAYSEVANTNSPIDYLKSELSVNISDQGYIRRLYEEYLDSKYAQRTYFEPIIEETELGLYSGNKYNGERRLRFIDLDADGVEECFLTVPFPSDNSLSYEVAYIFDIGDDKNIEEVFSSGDCGGHRAQQKFCIIKERDTYLLHIYYWDNWALWGSVYSYDGKKISLVWSYDCDVKYSLIFLVSNEYDFFENNYNSDSTDYVSAYYNNVKLPENILAVSESEFNSKHDYYLNSEVFRVPLYETKYRVTNPAGIIVRASADADSEKIGELNSGEVVVGHFALRKKDSNENYWIRIEYGEELGWVAMSNLTEDEQ